jgi:hypothetical protein
MDRDTTSATAEKMASGPVYSPGLAHLMEPYSQQRADRHRRAREQFAAAEQTVRQIVIKVDPDFDGQVTIDLRRQSAAADAPAAPLQTRPDGDPTPPA